MLTLVPGGHGDQGVHAVAGGVVGAVRVPGPSPRPGQQPHLEQVLFRTKQEATDNLHRHGEDDRDQDEGEDAAEANHQHAREVGLKKTSKNGTTNKN